MERFDPVTFRLNGEARRGYFESAEGGDITLYDCIPGCTRTYKTDEIEELKTVQPPGGIDAEGYFADATWRKV